MSFSIAFSIAVIVLLFADLLKAAEGSADDGDECLATLSLRIGRGGSGAVYLATIGDSQEVALKVVHKSCYDPNTRRYAKYDSGGIGGLAREILVMERIKRSSAMESVPWMLNYLGTYADQSDLYLSMELCLEDMYHFSENHGLLAPKHLKVMSGDVIRAIRYLHSLNIIHRDVKAENILISRDGYFKLADYNLSYLGKDPKDGPDDLLDDVVVGTIDFLPYEMATKCSYGPKVDIWGLGCVLFVLAVGNSPFRTQHLGSDKLEEVSRIIEKSVVDYKKVEVFDRTLTVFIRDAFAQNPDGRPSANECLLNYAWFSDIDEEKAAEIRSGLLRQASLHHHIKRKAGNGRPVGRIPHGSDVVSMPYSDSFDQAMRANGIDIKRLKVQYSSDN